MVIVAGIGVVGAETTRAGNGPATERPGDVMGNVGNGRDTEGRPVRRLEVAELDPEGGIVGDIEGLLDIGLRIGIDGSDVESVRSISCGRS